MGRHSQDTGKRLREARAALRSVERALKRPARRGGTLDPGIRRHLAKERQELRNLIEGLEHERGAAE